MWSITVGPLTPELWGYTFSVNGVRTLDPRNGNTKRDGTRIDNILLIPGPESELYEVKDVPHGNVSMVWYDSPTLKMKRRMYVYTPPDYGTSTARYPGLLPAARRRRRRGRVVHARPDQPDHGQPDRAGQGEADDRGHDQRQRLAEDGARLGPGPRPGAAADAGQRAAAAGARARCGSGRGSGGAAAPPACPRDAGGDARAFPESLVKDVIPFIEKNYRALPGKDNRAIAGLSMGGGHTTSATNNFPGTFGYIGVWSAGYRQTDEAAIKQFQAVKAAGVKLYHVGCGLEDKMALAGSQNLVEILKKVDMKYVFRESPGGHTWFNWRIYLKEYAPMLFR